MLLHCRAGCFCQAFFYWPDSHSDAAGGILNGAVQLTGNGGG